MARTSTKTRRNRAKKRVGQVISLDPRKVKRFRGQPRTWFDPEALQELADSIETAGQQMPILVKELSNGFYGLVEGERRTIACRGLGIPVLAMVIEVANEEDRFIKSCVSNFGREGHTDLEIVRAIERLLESRELEKRIRAETAKDDALLGVKGRNGSRKREVTKGEKVAYIARLFGKSPSWVWLHLRILRLAPEVQKMLDPNETKKEKLLSASVAIELAGKVDDDHEMQTHLAKNIVEEGMNAKKARLYMEQELRAVGKKPGRQKGPGRRQKTSYATTLLKQMLTRATGDMDQLMAMDPDELERIMAELDTAKQDDLLQRIDGAILQLKLLKRKLSASNASAGRGRRAA